MYSVVKRNKQADTPFSLSLFTQDSCNDACWFYIPFNITSGHYSSWKKEEEECLWIRPSSHVE